MTVKDQDTSDVKAEITSFAPELPADKPKTKPLQKKSGQDEAHKTLQAKYNFWKWFLGTFAIGAFTAITTFIIKEYQLKLETRKAESVYLSPYLKSYMELFSNNKLGYDRGSDMAKFLSCTVVDPD